MYAVDVATAQFSSNLINFGFIATNNGERCVSGPGVAPPFVVEKICPFVYPTPDSSVCEENNYFLRTESGGGTHAAGPWLFEL